MVTPAEHSPCKINRRLPVQNRQVTQVLIPVNIMLGMPQRNCQYHGICRIDLEDDLESACPHRVRARLGYDGVRITVYFEKGRMPAKTAKKHFASGFFIVLSDFTLPENLQALYEASLVIRRGIYPVRETVDHYIVHF